MCLIREDIPEGSLFVEDLKPHTIWRSLVRDLVPQTRYLRYPQNDSVATEVSGSAIQTSAAFKGVAAYLIDHVENTGAAGAALTAAQANEIAALIITEMESGNDLALADINTQINAGTGVSGSDLDGTLGNSTGSVAELMKILSGAEYIVPAASVVDTDGSTFNTTTSGSFTTGQYQTTYDVGGFKLSFHEGYLSVLVDSSFTYKGTAGAAVVVYDSDGTVYTG